MLDRSQNLVRHVLWRAAGPITEVLTEEPVAALTFDDGPDPAWTPRVLEVLGRHGARATFFMVGRAAADHPELVRSVAAMGHAVANHSWDHPSFPSLSHKARRDQIRSCQRAIAPFGVRLLRPPYGAADLATAIQSRLLGYELVVWNVDVGDWRTSDDASMARELSERVRAGSIVLLHDAPQPDHPDRGPMISALDSFLAEASGRLRFVTLPELMRRGRWRTSRGRRKPRNLV